MCEISKQSGFGFKSFFDGVIYIGDEYNVIDYAMLYERPIVIKGPLFYKNSKGTEVAAIELGIYDTRGIFEFPDFKDVTLSTTSKSVQLKSDGYERGNSFFKWFLVPKEHLGKNIDISGTLKSSTMENVKTYDVIAKNGSKTVDGDLRLKVDSISESAGMIEVIYFLDWASGLTNEETTRAKKMMAEFKKTYNFSEEDTKWQEALMTRKNLKSLKVLSAKLVDTKGKEYEPQSGMNLGGLGVGLEGKYRFKADNSPMKIVFSIGEEEQIIKKILFKGLNLLDN